MPMEPLKPDTGIVRISFGRQKETRQRQDSLARFYSQQGATSMSPSQKENTMQPRSGKFLNRLSFLFSLLALVGVIVVLTTNTSIRSSVSTLPSIMMQQGEHVLQQLPNFSTITKCIWSG